MTLGGMGRLFLAWLGRRVPSADGTGPQHPRPSGTSATAATDDMARVQRGWRTWKAVLESRHPGTALALRPPATDADLDALRRALDGRWSLQLEALYRENDGEGDGPANDNARWSGLGDGARGGADQADAFFWTPAPANVGGRAGYVFMPVAGVDGVVDNLDMLGEVLRHGVDVPGLPRDAVLVPFGCDFTGNLLCLALPPGGGEGPVFEAAFGVDAVGIVAPDLAAHLEFMARSPALSRA